MDSETQHMVLRVVEPDSVRKFKLTSRPSSVQQLILKLKEGLSIDTDFTLMYEDPDFDGQLTSLVDINELPQKAVVHIKLTEDSSEASTEILSDISSPERLCRWPTGQFPVPLFGFDVELILKDGQKEFERNGTQLKLTRDQRRDILEKMASVIYGFKAYQSTKEIEKAAAALVEKHPCLKEKGSGTGYDAWANSLKYKMANMRTKMRKAGCQEVMVNAGKRSHSNPDGDSSHSNIKKPKRAEINFLPNFPRGEDASSLEEQREQIVEEIQKVEKNMTTVGKLMQTTFALRRQNIVVSAAPVKNLLELWPALQLPSEVYAEFQRITNKNLQNSFYSALDMHTTRLMTLLRQKASKTGKTADALVAIFKVHDEQIQHDVHTRRTTVLHALPAYLREETSGFFITCDEDAEGLDLSATPVALLSNGGDGCPVNYGNKVSVVLEGQEIVTLGNFPEAFLVMFGLMYALHLSYPKQLKLTFEFVQKIFLGLEDGKLSPRLQTLRNELTM